MKSCLVALLLLAATVSAASEGRADRGESARDDDSSEKGDKKDAKIVIVGAGAAGIAAATKLHKHGFKNVKVLEAKNRIGGRIHTVPFSHSFVDLGEDWIQGRGGNIVYDIVSRANANLLSEPFDWRLEFRRSNGSKFSDETRQKLREMLKENSREDDPESTSQTVGEQRRKKLEKMLRDTPEMSEETRQEILEMADKVEMVMERADSFDDISMRNMEERRQHSDSKFVTFKQRGFSTLIDIMLKKYPNPSEELPIDIRKNSEVTRIDYGDDKQRVEVRTKDGEKHEADYVILAVPLGVLKLKKDTMFNPPLPKKKIDTINNLGFGSNAKIYLNFDKPPLDELKEDEKERVYAFSFVEADKRKLEETKPEKKWLLDVVGVYMSAERPTVLEMDVVGKGARASEKLDDETVKSHVHELLKHFFKNKIIPKPKEMIRTKWHSDEHFRGTKTYYSRKSEQANVFTHTLEEPITKKHEPVILMAGEHTSPHHFGTTHGAIISGMKQAGRIMERERERKEKKESDSQDGKKSSSSKEDTRDRKASSMEDTRGRRQKSLSEKEN